ncbi:MAG: hypothetical protein R3308_06810 [Thiohalobacterales bacterium]|nr:hypothetical protein [Thiohalobacterales bacterium]
MDRRKVTTAVEGKPDFDAGRLSGDSLSMHANVPVWCDCCSCEAEPYWVAAFEDPDDKAEPEV